MRIKKIEVRNFRLLKEIVLSLDKCVTVIVGRNNTGKTSLTELFRRLSSGNSPAFSIEDFNMASHSQFWDAYKLYQKNSKDEQIRKVLPTIDIRLTVDYSESANDLSILSGFIIDLDLETKEAIVDICYRLQDGKLKTLFDGCSEKCDSENEHPNKAFFKLIKERIPRLYSLDIRAIDPTDFLNQKRVELSDLRLMLQTDFISAQRGLDDTTNKERDVLGKVLVKLLMAASQDTATASDQEITEKIELSVQELQEKVDTDFNNQVTALLPALSLFGYPGLSDPHIYTETSLEVKTLMENHTRIRYASASNIGLPETYNGLGSRNLIYILLQMYQFFKEYQSKATFSGIHLIFVEEPEAHLHPQMQEVFIRQLEKITMIFEKQFANGRKWPVQFVVTTHSPHIANEIPFHNIRYFLGDKSELNCTQVKDLSVGLGGEENKGDREFLQKYLTLTRCDLFFADKAILVEGQSEHILMPQMIKKHDLLNNSTLSNQYISIVEIGGAYAHHFYRFLDYLEIRTLIITDLDSAVCCKNARGRTVYSACHPAVGTHSTNAGLKNWFTDLAACEGHSNLSLLKNKQVAEKVVNNRRIAFQIPETDTSDLARSFEDAFILANKYIFNLEDFTPDLLEEEAFDIAKGFRDSKLDFAIKYAVDETEWNIPLYILEGLEWLAIENIPIAMASTLANEVSE